MTDSAATYARRQTSHTTRLCAMAHDAAGEWPPQASNEEQTVRRRSSRNSYACLAKDIVARCLLWSGVIYAVRRLLWRDRVLIVVYHDPKPETLDSHLAYLCRIADPVRLSDPHDRCRSSTGRPRFVVTVDDGHAGNARLLDVFRAHRVRPTIFLCSAIVGTHRQYWWQHSEAVTGRIEQLKRMPNVERLAVLSTMGFAQDAEMHAPAALSKRDVEHIKGSVDFQSHGRFHPILPCCDDEDCRIEIGQSRLEIEKLVGRFGDGWEQRYASDLRHYLNELPGRVPAREAATSPVARPTL